MPEVVISRRPGGVPSDLGAPTPPGSKSHAQRALLLAAAAVERRGAEIVVENVPDGDDVAVGLAALQALGVGWRREGAAVHVTAGLRPGSRAVVDLRENGTALRTLPIVVAMLEGALHLDGAEPLRRRPVQELLAVLEQGGVAVDGEALPLRIDGAEARWPAALTVDAHRTTQVATGALLGAAARAWAGRSIPAVRVLSATAPGYVAMTTAMLRAFGIDVQVDEHPGAIEARLRAAGAPPGRYAVPADASALAFPRALAAMHRLTFAAGAGDAHPDHAIEADLQRLSAAPPGGQIHIDVGSHPDSFPALVVVAATRPGRTVLGGALALRHKESDRIAAMAVALEKTGVAVVERGDGLEIRGPLPPRAAVGPLGLPAPADHRVVMALALLGTVIDGGVALPHPVCVAKSWPGFWTWLGRVAAVVRLQA